MTEYEELLKYVDDLKAEFPDKDIALLIVEAIKWGANKERIACAGLLERAADDWPDEPQVQRVLLSHAEGIRERGTA